MPIECRDWVNHWPCLRDPRSLPYRQGFQYGYDRKAGFCERRGRFACPYAIGTVEADAWYAGNEAGRAEAGRLMDLAAQEAA